MHDINSIRKDPIAFDQRLGRRGIGPHAEGILKIDTKRRVLLTHVQELQAKRNQLAKEFGAAKAKGLPTDQIQAQSEGLRDEITALERQAHERDLELKEALDMLPNLPLDDVPDGSSEDDNQVVRTHGTPRVFDFAPLSHSALGEALGLMDFAGAAQMSGARFVVLKGALAQLERALANFMLDLHAAEFGYTPVSPPLLVKSGAVYGTGQLPKFAEDLFHTDNDYWLIPTAEVSLTNMAANTIFSEGDLPLRLVAHTPCFRSEAGAAGRDTQGMIRQHQFYKVELVSIVAPDQSGAEHERMTAAAEAVLQRLELPYRTLLLCTGDMGASAQKTYDIEVWLPSEGRYREISSCSTCGDYQARRMQAKVRRAVDGGKAHLDFVHTLNGSGVAVGRALIAVLENYQQADGSIAVPSVLQPYMGGLENIK